MATLTIRNLDEDIKEAIRLRAARHKRSMEEEVRIILRRALEPPNGKRIVEAALARFGKKHGVDLELPPRTLPRDPPDFS
jgi:plasmid stability protein